MTVSRRAFCTTLGASLTMAASLPKLLSAGTGTPSEKTLKVIAYNIYALHGWPQERPLAKAAVAGKQMARRLAMELQLYDPDIVTFSESPAETLTKEVADLMGLNHVRFPSGGNWPGTLLTRLPIKSSQNVPLGEPRPEELFTRHWGTATVELPDGSPLIIHSAHLYPVQDPTVRLIEIRRMLGAMKADMEANRSMLLIGDLNHQPDTEEYRLWMEAGWTDTLVAVGKEPGLTFKAAEPEIRIDYVMARGPIAKQAVHSRPLFEGAFRVAPDDEKGFALSDHLPQYAEFKL